MKRTDAFFALLVAIFNLALIALGLGWLIKGALFNFEEFIQGFLGFALVVGCLTALVVAASNVFPKLAEFLEWLNEKSKEKSFFTWHQRHASLIFLSVMLAPLIYTASDVGLSSLLSRLNWDLDKFNLLNSHIKISIILYEVTLGLVIGVVLNFFKNSLAKDKSLQDISDEYASYGLIAKISIAFAVMVCLSLDLMVSDAALLRYRFSEEGKFLLSAIALAVAYSYLKKNDGVDVFESKSYALRLIPILAITYLVISPSSLESHYSSIRASLTETSNEKMQKQLYDALKKNSYDSIVLTERELMTDVNPYRYMPFMDAKGNLEIKITHECTPQAIYFYSYFTNSNYYDLIKDEVAHLERLGSYTDEVKQSCFKELNTVWAQKRSLAMKSVFVNACTQRLIACN